MFYVGRGKHSREHRYNETVVELWKVIVNGKSFIYRGTEQAVMTYVSDKYYYDDWHIAPYPFLVLESQVINL